MIFTQYFAGLWLIVSLGLPGSIFNLAALITSPSERLMLSFSFLSGNVRVFSFFLVFCNFSQGKALLCFPRLLTKCKTQAFFLKPGMLCREPNSSALMVRGGLSHCVFGCAKCTDLL